MRLVTFNKVFCWLFVKTCIVKLARSQMEVTWKTFLCQRQRNELVYHHGNKVKSADAKQTRKEEDGGQTEFGQCSRGKYFQKTGWGEHKHWENS